jgi:hypothetical protein
MGNLVSHPSQWQAKLTHVWRTGDDLEVPIVKIANKLNKAGATLSQVG